MIQLRMRLPVYSALVVVPLLAACQDGHPLDPAGEPADAGPRTAVSTAGSARYPYRCATSLVPDQAAANVELRNSYLDWLSTRVTSGGTRAAGQLRVNAGPRKGGGTVSEGQGYGMLLAVYLGDKKTFDELWRYSEYYHQFNGNGVMPWHVDASGNVVDKNAATDADEDMAFALLVADKKWGGYWNDLTALTGAMKQHMVEPGTYVLKPGDVWGGSHALYVSYLAPAYYKAFAAYVGDPFWNNMADKSYQIIDNINGRGQNSATGLVPDYAQASGDPVAGSDPDDYWFSWDAIRAPWRLAKDAAWNCDARAKAQLDKMNPFFAGPGGGPTGIKSGYELNGTVAEPWHSVAFVGPLTAAALVSTDGTYRTAMWNHTVELRDTSYYAAELRLLGMLLASGNMEDPLAGQRRRRVDDFESGSISQWWTYADAAGSTLSKQLIRPAAVGYGMQVDYSVVSWAGIAVDVNRDWSGYRSFEFWVRGGGTGNRIGIELEDADGELFRHEFVDDFTGWKFSSIPLDTNGFPRRTDWQPTTVNNGLTLTTVKVLRFTPLGGQGSFAVDRIELIPR